MKVKPNKQTKLKLEEIPKANSLERKWILDITKQPLYLKALDEGVHGFKEDELIAIEEKYKRMTMDEILKELKSKGWNIKQDTIKHYIKVGQIPAPFHRIKREGRIIPFYQKTFLRHLNLVAFAMNAGKEKFNEIKKSIPEAKSVTDYDAIRSLALWEYDDFLVEIQEAAEYEWTDSPVTDLVPIFSVYLVHFIGTMLSDGVKAKSCLEHHSRFIFSSESEKYNNYSERLSYIKDLAKQLSEEISQFIDDCKKSPLEAQEKARYLELEGKIFP